MSINDKTNYSRNEIITETSTRLKKSGYHIKQEGNILEATNGRDYSTGIIVGLVIVCLLSLLLGLVVLLVYYFTRTQNKMVIDANKKGEFTIRYEGKKASEEALGLSNLLRSGEPQTAQ